MTPAVVTFAEAAATLGLARTTAYRLLADGTFPVPVITIGPRKRVVSRARLHAFIEGELSPVASTASPTAPDHFPSVRGEGVPSTEPDESSSGAANSARTARPEPRASSSQGVTATARVASSGSTSRKRAGAATPALPRSAAS